MRSVALVLGLGACGGGGLGPDDDSYAILLGTRDSALAFSDTGKFAAVMQSESDYSGWFCSALVSNTTNSGFGTTATIGWPSRPCVNGVAFDADEHAFLAGGDVLAVGGISGPWATFALGAAATCAPTLLSDGSWVACAGTDLVAIAPEGPLVYRAALGGTPLLAAIADDDDTVFVAVEREDGTWRLVAIAASGALVFDVAIGEPQDAPSLDNDGAVLVSVVTAAGPAVQVFDPADGALVSEVPLDKPAFTVLVAEDDDWVVAEKGVNADGGLTGEDTLVRMRPDGEARWTRDATNLWWPVIDDKQRLWVSAADEVHVLTSAGHEVDAFFTWGDTTPGPPVLNDGWYGATYDGSGVVARLYDPDVNLATTGWPRRGGSNRNNGRRPAP